MLASARREHGFSLVEVLVGMAIGVLVLIVIMQTFAVAEGYKRTTTSGTDAQINGLSAMRTLESEVRMAGYGLMNGASLCPTINRFYNGTSTSTTSMPVQITDGGSGADSIDVIYSSADTGAAPSRIVTAMPTPSNVTKVSTLGNLSTCDFVLFAAKDGSKACSVLQVTGLEPNNVQFQTGSGQSNYNPNGGAQVDYFPSGGYSTSDVIINLGKQVGKRFSVRRTGTTDEYFFHMSNTNAANDGCSTPDPTPELDMVSNVVSLKAQYGVAVAGSQQVTCWTSAAATNVGCGIAAGSNWSAPTPVDAKRIKALRVAVVARSALTEKPSTGSTCDTTTTAPASWSGGPTINLSAVPNWMCYRYKVYQTEIPIMNVIWANT